MVSSLDRMKNVYICHWERLSKMLNLFLSLVTFFFIALKSRRKEDSRNFPAPSPALGDKNLVIGHKRLIIGDSTFYWLSLTLYILVSSTRDAFPATRRFHSQFVRSQFAFLTTERLRNFTIV